MVAPSYQKFEIVSETFLKNNRWYIKVKNPSTNTIKEVRWYTDKEYNKAYGKKQESIKDGWQNLKHARGFDNGPILVIRNNTSSDEEWLENSIARYAVSIGWYIISTDTLPADAPSHFHYLLLEWEEFRDRDDYHMKKPAEIEDILRVKAQKGEWINFI